MKRRGKPKKHSAGQVYRERTKKVRYRDEFEAAKEAKRCADIRGVPLRVYPCPECRGYHLTKR